MSFENETLKIKLWFYRKREKKRICVPMIRSHFYLFGVIDASYYQEGHSGIVDKNVRVLKTFKSFLLPSSLSGRIFRSGCRTLALVPNRIYPTTGRTYLMHQTYSSPERVPVSWQLGSVRHILPLIEYIRPARHVRSPGRVLELWQLSLVDTYLIPIGYI
jgi:hypothetical protein